MAARATIRAATAAELERVAELHAEVNDFHHTASPAVFATGLPQRVHLGLLRPYVGADGAALLVAGTQALIVGYVCVQLVQESNPLFRPVRFGRIESLGVTPQSRGQGLGRALVQAAQDWARTRGATEVHLNVWSFNEAAQRLYRALGYEVRAQYMGRPLSEG